MRVAKVHGHVSARVSNMANHVSARVSNMAKVPGPLMAKVSRKVEGLDCSVAFSLIVKLTIVRLVHAEVAFNQ